MSIENGTGHASTVTLTADARQHPHVFAAAFNSGSPEAVAAVYEERAVLVPRPGAPVTGAGLASATAEFLALGLPIAVEPRHAYVADDIALLIVDWVIEGPDGSVRIEGTATDVARRGADGLWRYVIDNPFGVAESDRAAATDERPFDEAADQVLRASAELNRRLA
ncbi:YybH family protein [Nocardia harenae]|uniref:YybH family protein n=1 Tax=Nocardia harenae TaxID=358707 RepID=UPI000A0542AC|nr:DUF4440 domain-containing protein [Nocardia harenae]